MNIIFMWMKKKITTTKYEKKTHIFHSLGVYSQFASYVVVQVLFFALEIHAKVFVVATLVHVEAIIKINKSVIAINQIC